jgi:hypothetical protein
MIAALKDADVAACELAPVVAEGLDDHVRRPQDAAWAL